MNSRRRARVLAPLLVLALTLSVPPPARAASIAALDCSRAVNGTGQVGVYMPAPGVATYDYMSRFWVKFDSAGYYGYDWKQLGGWRWGDSQATWILDPNTNQWGRLAANSWAFWDNFNSGTVHLWEEQYYWKTQTWLGHPLGKCVVWQFFVFVPFVLP